MSARKTIIAQAILEKNSAAIHQPGNSTDESSRNSNHMRESNIITANLSTRWEPGSGKPTIKSTMSSRLLPGMPQPVPKILAEKTIARLDACDKLSASALDKFYKSKERSRLDSAQGSAGIGGVPPAFGTGDPRLAGRSVDYDPTRDPRLRR